MDIEQLSKSQIVLLTLLVSFVTSIATGIVTVSLMDQAPPVVAQTVNRVIEHTVQTVVPGHAAATAVTQEKTVVVKESDLISQAVDHINPSIVRLYSNDAESPVFLGLGVVLNASGTIATDSTALSDSADGVVELPNSSRVRAFVTSHNTDEGIAFLTPATTTIDGKTPVWTPVALSTQQPTLGETVVMLAGNTLARIGDGIITSIVPGATKSFSTIDTNILADSIMDGSPLIDTDGTLIGMSTGFSRAISGSGFLAAPALMNSDASK
jgi:hypothetical protein